MSIVGIGRTNASHKTFHEKDLILPTLVNDIKYDFLARLNSIFTTSLWLEISRKSIAFDEGSDR